jgi:nicotinamide riboside kinase
MEENLKQQQTNRIKVALYGPESSGKTTLAKQLASHFNTVWIPEFARDYLQEKLDKTGKGCVEEDMIPIAVGQIKLENEALATANKFLFCDTNVLVTKVFSEVYYGFCDPILDKAAEEHNYDLFFLTDIDLPFEQDDLRDSRENRDKFFAAFEKALIETNKPYIKISGNKEQRLENAISIVNELVKAKEMGFSSHDFVQIYEQGVSLLHIEKQLTIFQNGIPKITLEAPATLQKGIWKLSDSEFTEKALFFDTRKSSLKLEKFVPASGAASRMFKFLSEFLNDFDIEKDTINGYINKNQASSLTIFLAGMEKFPFFDEVHDKLKATFSDFPSWTRDKKNYYFIKFLIGSENFNFANKPKGILPFHYYKNHIATPIEEHLNESASYASSNGISNLHFTVSKEHQKQFEDILATVQSKIESSYAAKINISFSYQNKKTDTLAVDFQNNPFREEDAKLVFRPGGHGALIENLNNIEADIIFIKNIDNVIQNHIDAIALYKKALAGILMALQDQIFTYLKQIDANSISEKEVEAIVSFAKDKLNSAITTDFAKMTLNTKVAYIKEMLNKPIRICGMVKNENEPGGGPFWVRDSNGNSSLQIIESSQIDLQDEEQLQLFQQATHFNPVDIVCGVKNYKGQKFNLHHFIDENSGFIVVKNKNGKDIKAYELPGLWNGAMANWLTVFVEVPLITFNPVKTVNDLLKPTHQPE